MILLSIEGFYRGQITDFSVITIFTFTSSCFVFIHQNIHTDYHLLQLQEIVPLHLLDVLQ